MSRNSFYLYLRIANYLGVVPWIHKKGKRLSNNLFAKIYPAAIAFGASLCFFLKIEDKASALIGSYLSVLPTIMILISLNINRKYWTKWIYLYEITNRKIKMEFNQTLELDVTSILFVIPYAIAVLLLIILRWISDIETLTDYKNLLFCTRLTAECLPIVLSKVLLKGFKILNRFPENPMESDRTEICTVSNTNTSKAIVFRNLFEKLFKMSMCFNAIFGWLIVIYQLDFLASVCNMLNVLINSKLEIEKLVGSIIFWFFCIFRMVSRNDEFSI